MTIRGPLGDKCLLGTNLCVLRLIPLVVFLSTGDEGQDSSILYARALPLPTGDKFEYVWTRRGGLLQLSEQIELRVHLAQESRLEELRLALAGWEFACYED